MMNHIRNITISLLTLSAFASCAAAPVITKIDKKKNGVTVVHHISKAKGYARDRMVGINSKGAVVSQAEVKVYDVGRLPDGHGGMREASRYYQIVHSATWDLRLPKKGSDLANGPKTIFTPPNYSEPPNDQRVSDAVADAQEAKRKLDEKTSQLSQSIDQTNVMKGELQDQIDRAQQLANQLKAAFHTEPPKAKPETDAEKAAANVGTDSLADFGKQVGN
jgi:hypothetical protein